ncbi:Hypothetical predicted protein [Mytilus galloprovincialis]|uniref:C-type lectin domain-containing protein n=1 Tax=Mytilus galloprovincialis TaxID=29158 RepID=A0A8B6GS69_MYTGA|nr:Hypothetical predicted protein [Mytilus galloprovincialis]
MITTQFGVTYEDARYMCINDYGMDLVVICDDDVMTEVTNYLPKNRYAYLENVRTDIWIGLVWNASLLDFVWVNNDVLAWIPPWYADEPNCMSSSNVFCHIDSTYNQNCVRMSNDFLEWKTQACIKRNGALCQNLTSPCKTTTTTESITLPNSSSMLSLFNTMTTTESMKSTYISTAASTTNHNFSGVTVATTCPPCNCSITPQISSRNSSSLDVYKVDKYKTGAHIRMHTSAEDNRLSSKVMGYTGLIVICSVFFLVVLIDLTRIQDRRKNKSFLKT